VLSLVLKAIILEQGEKMMQDSVAVLISDVEGKWGLGLVALNVLFDHFQELLSRLQVLSLKSNHYWMQKL